MCARERERKKGCLGVCHRERKIDKEREEIVAGACLRESVCERE